jgi:hypothetical protein
MDKPRDDIMAIPEELLNVLGFFGYKFHESLVSSREKSLLETTMGTKMNSFFGILTVCLVSVAFFDFPLSAQCNDWLQPTIARAVSTSMTSGNVDQMVESSIIAYPESDNSAQVTQQPMSTLIDPSEIALIMHSCSEAAAVCP